MALNIDLVNGAINVYETGEVPRTYFGAIGASGKFYQSGSVDNGIGSVVLYQNNLENISDGDYDDVPISSTSGNGVGAFMNISIVDGSVYGFQRSIPGSGYAIGDTLTIDGDNFVGTGNIIFKVASIQIDSLLIVIGGDDYQVKWSDLIINGQTPSSLSNAAQLLSALFSSLSMPYKSYTAIYTQNGVIGGDPPNLVNILENKITPNQTPTISYINSGIFNLDFGGAVLTTGKTFAICNMWGDDGLSPRPASAYPLNDSSIRIANGSGDDGNYYILVEIRVYN